MTSTEPIHEGELTELPVQNVDVLVAGSGAGGLSAAVTAAYHGLSVLVAEKASVCGGATSWSGGWAWTPGTTLARDEGVIEDTEEHRTYLRAVLGERYTPQAAEKIDAFLAAVPRMVDFFHHRTALQFVTGAAIHDIYGNLPGAGTGNRSVAPEPFNATSMPRELVRKMRRQYYPTSLLGMGVMAGKDLSTMLSASRFSPKGWVYAASRVLPHAWDMLTRGRSMHLVNGTALTARLMQSAWDLGVQLETNTAVERLMVDDAGRVTGAVVSTPGGRRVIKAARGVVLATGGFPHNVQRRRELFPKTPTGREHWSLAPETANGSGLDLALSVGGVFDTDMRSPAA